MSLKNVLIIIINMTIMSISIIFVYYYSLLYLLMLLLNTPLLFSIAFRLYSFTKYYININRRDLFYDKTQSKEFNEKLLRNLEKFRNIKYSGGFGVGKTFYLIKIFKYYAMYQGGYSFVYKNMWWSKRINRWNFDSPKISGGFFGINFDISRFNIFRFVYFFIYILLDVLWYIIWKYITIMGITKYKEIIIIDEPNKDDFNHSFINQFFENKQLTILVGNSTKTLYADKIFTKNIEHLKTRYPDTNLRFIKSHFNKYEKEIEQFLNKIKVNIKDKNMFNEIVRLHAINEGKKIQMDEINNILKPLVEKYNIKRKLSADDVLSEISDEQKYVNYIFQHQTIIEEKNLIKYLDELLPNRTLPIIFDSNNLNYIFKLLWVGYGYDVFRHINSDNLSAAISELNLLRIFDLEHSHWNLLSKSNRSELEEKVTKLLKSNNNLVLYYFWALQKEWAWGDIKYKPGFLSEEIKGYGASICVNDDQMPAIDYIFTKDDLDDKNVDEKLDKDVNLHIQKVKALKPHQKINFLVRFKWYSKDPKYQHKKKIAKKIFDLINIDEDGNEIIKTENKPKWRK